MKTKDAVVREVGDRVAVYSHRGERMGRGTVVETQLYSGEYCRVRMDAGGEAGLPAGAKPAIRQDMTKRLVKKEVK